MIGIGFAPSAMHRTLEVVAEKLHGRTILITGANGFVGQSMVDLLAILNSQFDASIGTILVARDASTLNHSVQTLTLSGARFITVIQSQIGSSLVAPEPPDFIVHLATPASTTLNVDSPQKMLELNIEGVNWVLSSKSVLQNKPKLFFASSGAVYGNHFKSGTLIEEGCPLAIDPLDAGSAYGEGKRVAELLFSQAARDGLISLVVGRLFAFSGPHLPLDRHFAIGNFVLNGTQERKITVRGDGTAVRSYLDSRDMTLMILLSLVSDVTPMPLHIGSSSPISIKELAYLVAERIEQITGQSCEIEVQGTTSKYDGFAYYVPSVTKTLMHLGYEPCIELHKSIDDMLENLLT